MGASIRVRTTLDLPYLVHTNRELGLMLAAAKPLAKFCDAEGCFPEVVQRYLRLFDCHVATGQLVRHDRFTASTTGRVHSIYYTSPGEEWRVDAMVQLFARPGPWTAEREREEGRLFGYTNAENDFWAERFSVGRSSQSGVQ